MIRNKILIGLTLIFLSSCSYQEPITFLRLKEVKVNGINNGELLLSAEALFNNPNSLKGKIKKVNIYVLYRGDTLANVHHINKMNVPANSNFSVPLSLAISINQLQKGLLSNLSSLLRKKSVELEFKGNIKVGVWGINQKIPVDYSETIAF